MVNNNKNNKTPRITFNLIKKKQQQKQFSYDVYIPKYSKFVQQT